MLLLLASVLLTQPHGPPFEVESAKARPDLTAWFTRTQGWTGSDGAYSIPLGPKRMLWLFGDTWIGDIADGRRVRPRLINNSAAWQDLTEKKSLRFFWDETGKEPAALLKTDAEGAWYWPGDAALIDGKLYLFAHVVRRKAEGAAGFQFDWFADDLLRIDNPQELPTGWKIVRRRLGAELKHGVACCVDGDHLYAFGLFFGKHKPFEAPLAVSRIHRDRLSKLDLTGWEYWSTNAGWSTEPKEAAAILADGASEMSVQRLRGIEGFVAVYMPLGLSQDIVVRHAPRPEGPWSTPLKVYRCPKEPKDVFIYAAKGHAELAEKDGQLFITYCRNIGVLGEHVRRPEVYIPQVVEVQLRKKD